MFQAVNLQEFEGQKRSFREISRLTGVCYWTLVKRAQRGRPLVRPKPVAKTRKRMRRRPTLTGDWQKDVELIVAYMQRRLAR